MAACIYWCQLATFSNILKLEIMRNIIVKLLLIISATIICSCVGQKEPESDFSVTISASQPNISVESGESVTLRVKNFSVDVTDQSEVYYIENGEEVILSGGEFIASHSGEYPFRARYSGVDSKDYALVRAYTDDELTAEFYRRNLIMKFTGTWCVNCPAMGDAIESVKYSNSNRIIEMAIHCIDDLAVNEGSQLAADYSFTTLPVALVDMLYSTNLSSSSIIEALIENSIEENPTIGGVRIETSLDGINLNVEVGIKGGGSSNYRVAVALLIDNYNYEQTGADDPNYKQDNVLRFYISDLYGDVLDGLSLDAEIVKSYNVSLPSEALLSESRVVAYLLNEINGSYIVNNVTECVIGNSINYMYEIESAQ